LPAAILSADFFNFLPVSARFMPSGVPRLKALEETAPAKPIFHNMKRFERRDS
jgi:hypothetical protein